MSRWRLALLAFFFTAPLIFLIGVGCYSLWEKGWGFVAWWPMAACLALGYLLAWHWQRQKKLLPPPDFRAPPHWTDRDKQAWQLVEARAKAAAKIDPNKLVEVHFYLDTAQEMALELARAYHPGAGDPVGKLTIPEILTVAELASHDLAELVDQYLPGGHFLTIDHLRQARKATDWYQRGSNVYWIIAAVFAPLETGVRYLASQAGHSRPWRLLQQNLLLWFYTAYLHRLGTYLIELNSGRLRVGVKRYRELVREQKTGGPSTTDSSSAAEQVRQVTMAVVGQVKAGKSSLINALLGEQRAHTDVLPATDQITRYELQPAGIPSRFVLLDTVGYGHDGPKADQLKATQTAAQQADLILLVLHARNPARQADVEMLQALENWFASRPDLKMPPILGVLTHIDVLSPALEWAPPYDWQQPARMKEQQIHEAVLAVREQLDAFLAGCVPVCTLPGKTYGAQEWCLPAIVELVDEARAVAILRCLRAELDTGKVRKVLHQVLAAGKQTLRILRESQRK
jgi:predicted GTPase